MACRRLLAPKFRFESSFPVFIRARCSDCDTNDPRKTGGSRRQRTNLPGIGIGPIHPSHEQDAEPNFRFARRRLIAQDASMMASAELQQFIHDQTPAAFELLRRMVGINSFTGNRDGVNQLGRFTAESFASLGFTAEFV